MTPSPQAEDRIIIMPGIEYANFMLLFIYSFHLLRRGNNGEESRQNIDVDGSNGIPLFRTEVNC